MENHKLSAAPDRSRRNFLKSAALLGGAAILGDILAACASFSPSPQVDEETATATTAEAARENETLHTLGDETSESTATLARKKNGWTTDDKQRMQSLSVAAKTQSGENGYFYIEREGQIDPDGIMQNPTRVQIQTGAGSVQNGAIIENITFTLSATQPQGSVTWNGAEGGTTLVLNPNQSIMDPDTFNGYTTRISTRVDTLLKAALLDGPIPVPVVPTPVPSS